MSLTRMDLNITLPQTDPVVWRRIIVPDYTDVTLILRAVALVFSWDGSGEWDVDIADDTSLHTHFETHDTLTVTYQVGEHSWRHVIECMNRGLEVEDPEHVVVLVGGEHPAPFDDIGSPEAFTQLLSLRRAHLAGEPIDTAELPDGYELEDLDELDYNEAYTRELLEEFIIPRLDTMLSELFAAHYEANETPTPEHASLHELLVQLERGGQLLGLDREGVLVTYGYLSFLLDHPDHALFAHPEHLIAAALFELINTTHPGEEREPVPAPLLHAAFGVELSAQPELAELIETMRPSVEAIDIAEAGQRAVDTYEAARAGSLDNLSPRQRAEIMWREPMGVEMLEWSPQRDFIMYVLCQKFDPTLAPEDEDPPDYLFIATDEVQDTVLTMIPWYGELGTAQRHAALCRTVLIACAIPTAGEPSRPLGIVLENGEDARAVQDFYPYEDTPVMSMATLEKSMAREAAHKSSTRKKPRKKNKSKQKKARRKNRKKK